MKVIKKPMLFLLVSLFMFSCSSAPKKLDANKEIISDQGELTRQELENTAQSMAIQIAYHIKGNMNPAETYVAFLPTINDTTEEIAVDLYDQNMVQILLQKKIPVLKASDRHAALKELEFSQSGITENELEAGKMKSATHFIQTKILENVFNASGDKIIEHTILTELRDVQTTVVLFSKKKIYRKKVSRNQISW